MPENFPFVLLWAKTHDPNTHLNIVCKTWVFARVKTSHNGLEGIQSCFSRGESMPKHALPSVGLRGEQLFWKGNSPDNCVFLKTEKSITASAFKKWNYQYLTYTGFILFGFCLAGCRTELLLKSWLMPVDNECVLKTFPHPCQHVYLVTSLPFEWRWWAVPGIGRQVFLRQTNMSLQWFSLRECVP